MKLIAQPRTRPEQPHGSAGWGGRSGGALAVSLVAVIVVAALAASFLQVSSAVHRRQRQSEETMQAFYLAEAGLAEAFAGLAVARTGNVGSSEEPVRFGDGLFWVEAEEEGDGLVTLESTGLHGRGRATLSMIAEEGEDSVAALGIFAEQALTVPPGVRIDGYDSSLGSYSDQQQAGELVPTEVGSNEGVTVRATSSYPTEIHGSVVPGAQAGVTIEGSPLITGSLEPRPDNSVLPPVDVPSVPMLSGVRHGGPAPLVLMAGEYGLPYLTVERNAKVVVEGPLTLVVGGLSLEAQAELELDTTLGPVQIYVTGDLDFSKGSHVNVMEEDPSRVTVQLSEEAQAVLKATSAFHGALYGPLARFEVGRAFELFGSLAGRELSLERGARLHFDEHLARLGAEGSLPTQSSWRIVDFSPVGSGSIGDPFRLLGVDPTLCPKPADAHADQWLKVAYIDRWGTARMYEGWESGFDWRVVRKLYGYERDGKRTSLTNVSLRSLTGLLGSSGGSGDDDDD